MMRGAALEERNVSDKVLKMDLADYPKSCYKIWESFEKIIWFCRNLLIFFFSSNILLFFLFCLRKTMIAYVFIVGKIPLVNSSPFTFFSVVKKAKI